MGSTRLSRRPGDPPPHPPTFWQADSILAKQSHMVCAWDAGRRPVRGARGGGGPPSSLERPAPAPSVRPGTRTAVCPSGSPSPRPSDDVSGGPRSAIVPAPPPALGGGKARGHGRGTAAPDQLRTF